MTIFSSMSTNQDHIQAAEHTHPDDPGLQKDHAQLLDLMAARAGGAGEGVAGVAIPVQSGDWSDPATWGGVSGMPGPDMTVVIPEGISVTMDADPGVKLMSVVVYGGLEFEPSADITLYIDELLTAPDSVLHIGTPDDPVTGDIDIIIREDTPDTLDHGRKMIDPGQLGKGIVTHGEVRIEGAEKTSHLKVSVDPMAGDTSITFDELPEGWAAGDKIVITGTHIVEDFPDRQPIERIYHNKESLRNPSEKTLADIRRDDPDWDPANYDPYDRSTLPKGPGDWRFEMEEFKTQDEMRVVTEVTQNADGTYTVSFDDPLEFNHDAPKDVGVEAGRDGVDLFASVANYTRNITVSSEVAHSDHPEGSGDVWVDENGGFGDGQIHDRGHVMFMHNPDVEVRNAEFAGMGRTDKNIPIDNKNWEWVLKVRGAEGREYDWKNWKPLPKDDDGNFVSSSEIGTRDPMEVENAAGRYGVHAHRLGVQDTGNPAIFEGLAVWETPGWGIVHHDSHLEVIDSAVFGIRGGGIISESGNETGKWTGNIVVKTSGTGDNLFDSGGGTGREFNLDDSFFGGTAFGFESRLIETEGNVVANAQAFGYKFHGPGPDSGSPSADNFKAAQGYDPFWGDQDIPMVQAPNRTFVDNESYGTNVSFGSTLNKAFPNTIAQTTLDGFKSWNSDTGVQFHYARGYVIKDSIFVGDEEYRPDAHGYDGSIPRGQKGIDPITDVDLIRVINSHFEDLESDFTNPPPDVFVANTATNVRKEFKDGSHLDEMPEDHEGVYYQARGTSQFGTLYAEKGASNFMR